MARPNPQASKPHTIFPWNEPSYTGLYELEALAHDKLSMANTNMVAFVHVLNGALDPS